MLKVYADQRYRSEGAPVPALLEPLWRKAGASTDWWFQMPMGTALNRYFSVSSSLLRISSLDSCDIAVLPMDWAAVRGYHWAAKGNKEAARLAYQFADAAQRAAKRLVVFFTGDCGDEPVPLENAVVFRQSLYRSYRTPNDFACPTFVEDFVDQYFEGNPPVRKKGPKPVVGFCGLSRPVSRKERLKEPLYYVAMRLRTGRAAVSPYKGIEVRNRALRLLAESPAVSANFVTQGRGMFLNSANVVEEKRALRKQFVANMEQSDYILCARGSGNYSFRLYETLSCGRIPVFIDTDCVLPFDSQIDWKRFVVWIDESELDRLPEKLADFHHDLSANDFEELQLRCRSLWRERLSAEGFFTYFCKQFEAAPETRQGAVASMA